MFYEVNNPNSYYEIFSSEGKVLKKAKLTEKMSNLDKVGCICYFLGKGNSLKDVATGIGWRPSASFFLSLVSHNKTYESLYFKAGKKRINMLQEEMIALKNVENAENKIKNLVHILNNTKKQFEEKKRTVLVYNNWRKPGGEDKQNEKK